MSFLDRVSNEKKKPQWKGSEFKDLSGPSLEAAKSYKIKDKIACDSYRCFKMIWHFQQL